MAMAAGEAHGYGSRGGTWLWQQGRHMAMAAGEAHGYGSRGGTWLWQQGRHMAMNLLVYRSILPGKRMSTEC